MSFTYGTLFVRSVSRTRSVILPVSPGASHSVPLLPSGLFGSGTCPVAGSMNTGWRMLAISTVWLRNFRSQLVAAGVV